MKNRYRNSNYDQQWNNENYNYRRSTNQVDNDSDRYRQNNPNSNSWRERGSDVEMSNHNQPQSSGGSYSEFGNDD